MNPKVRNIFFKVYLWLLRVYGSRVLKLRTVYASTLFNKAYVYTFTLFPENNLNSNIELAIAARNELCEFQETDIYRNTDEDKRNQLIKKLIDDEWVTKSLSEYFLLLAHYFSYGRIGNSFENEISAAIVKAKKYSPSTEPFNSKDISNLKKSINKCAKTITQEFQKLNSQRLENEKLKIIEPFEVTSVHVLFLFSLFSTLFLISGVVYNKFIFGSFNFNISDFYTISDFISSSLSMIIPTIISSFVAVVMYAWGAANALHETLRNEQFELEQKKRKMDYFIPVIVFISAINLVYFSYTTGELKSTPLFVLIMFLFFEIFYRLTIWKYIKNKVQVGAIAISLFYFSMHLGFNIKSKIEEIRSNEYTPPYTLKFKEEYKDFTGHLFFASNSQYIFMISNDSGKSKKITAVPRAAVMSISAF